jgi:hypothetical protein
MSPSTASEDVLVEQPALELLKRLGWRHVHGAELAPDAPSGERKAWSDVVLAERLQSAVGRLNPQLPAAAVARACDLEVSASSPAVIEDHRGFHELLLSGVPVSYVDEHGVERHDHAWLVDFDDPERNEFLAVNQLTIIVAGKNLKQLTAQRAALPSSQLNQLDTAHARLVELSERRDELSASLKRLPAPKRNVLGREGDEHLIDRTRLSTMLNGTDDAIVGARETEVRLRQELGDPEQIRSELDGLDREIRQLTNERDGLLNNLTDRELQAPGEWAKQLLGERPTGSRSDDWDTAARRVARYRIEHQITDQADPLGPEPHDHHQARQWHRAHEAVERAERRLGREHTHEHEHDHGLDIGF